MNQSDQKRHLLFRNQWNHSNAPINQTSMEAAADRRREVEVLRRQLAQDETALQERRGTWGSVDWAWLIGLVDRGLVDLGGLIGGLDWTG